MGLKLLPAPVQSLLLGVAGGMGLRVELVTFLVVQLANILLARVLWSISSPLARMIFSVSFGMLWCIILYGIFNTISLIAIALCMYVVVSRRLLSPGYVTMLSIGIVSIFQIYKLVTQYMVWSMEITGPLMLFVAKFSMLAFDQRDGEKSLKQEPLSLEAHVAVARSKTCLQCGFPSLLEYFSYMFDFLGVLAGPVLHCREYLDFIYLRNDFSDLHHVHFGGVALYRFLSAMCLGALFGAAGMIPQLNFAYTESAAFLNAPFLYRFIVTHTIVITGRLKYFVAWYLSDVAYLTAGAGYDPNRRDKFTRTQNAIISKVDFANCQAEALSNWNISIARWLRSCVYLRALESPRPAFLRGIVGHKQYATILTRFVSAFWHGFYPGYYWAFLCTVLQSEADSVGRKFIKPLFTREGATKPHWTYTLLGKLHTAVCLNFYGAAFLLMSTVGTLRVWSNLYFVVHILNVSTILFVPAIFKQMRKRMRDEPISAASDGNKKTE